MSRYVHNFSLISSDRASLDPGRFSASAAGSLSVSPSSKAVFCCSKFEPWFLQQQDRKIQCSADRMEISTRRTPVL
jgi:hypothetical protein